MQPRMSEKFSLYRSYQNALNKNRLTVVQIVHQTHCVCNRRQQDQIDHFYRDNL